jgi:hypothetical protein
MKLTREQIEQIRACLGDGSYTPLERKDFGMLCDMALSALAAPVAKIEERIAGYRRFIAELRAGDGILEEPVSWPAVSEALHRSADTIEWLCENADSLRAALVEAERERDEYKAAATLHADACVRLTKQHAEAESALAAAKEKVERYEWCVKNAAWIRHEHASYVAVPVAPDADLSCVAMRESAIDQARALQPSGDKT